MRLRSGLFTLVGFAIGAVITVSLTLFNPFTPQAVLVEPIAESSADGQTIERFVIESPADIVAVTHNGKNIINPSPAGIAIFSEPEIQTGLVLIAKVRNADGRVVGFAMESEAIDDGSNLLIGKMRMNTDWTIVLPGRGTIFLSQIEDSGSLGKTIIPAVMLGGEWNGDAKFVSTVGPHPSGRGVVIGGTREFKNLTGTFVEVTQLTHLSQAKGGVGSFELQISYSR